MSPGGLQNPELMKKHLFLWMTLLAAGTLSAQNRNDTMDLQHRIPREGRGNARVAYLGQSIDRMVYEFMEEEGIPGLTLAIVQAPYIPRVVGYGVTDIREGRLAAVRTLWPAGPISQGFAAVAVIQLHELGKLSPDGQVQYLNDLRFMDFFGWLSRSIQKTSRSLSGEEVKYDPTAEWGEVKTVYKRGTVWNSRSV